MRALLLLSIIFILTFSIGHAQFIEISQQAKVNHIHGSPTLMGGGACMADFNKDGWVDFAVTGGVGEDLIYINERNKTFSKYLLPHNRYKISTTTAVISGDFNNDSCPDLIYSNLDKSEGLIILRGHCDGTFEDVSALSSIEDKGPSTGILVEDFNDDGLQDLYILNYIEEQGFIRDDDNQVIGFDHLCQPNILLLNKGDFVFENAPESFNAGAYGCALAATMVSISDSISGIYIANDFGEWLTPNEFLVFDEINNSFQDRAAEFNLDISLYGMGIALGDFDNDLDEDIYITNIGANYLMESNKGKYIDQGAELQVDNASILANQSTSWGTLFFDVENDGDLDLFVANGEITSAPFLNTAKKDPSSLYINDQLTFTNKAEEFNINDESRNRGVVSGDIDNDGDIDLLLSTISLNNHTNETSLRYKLLENISLSGNFLKIAFEDRFQNSFPFGTVVRIYADSLVQQRTIYSSGTFASQNMPIAHFGLGQRNTVDSLTIVWPSGMNQIFFDIQANEYIQVVEGKQELDVLGCMEESENDFNENATIPISCANSLTTSVPDIQKESIRYNSLVVHQLHIRFNSDHTYVLIQIYNVLGKLIVEELIDHRDGRIKFSNQPKGSYYFNIRSQGHKIYTGIFIKV